MPVTITKRVTTIVTTVAPDGSKRIERTETVVTDGDPSELAADADDLVEKEIDSMRLSLDGFFDTMSRAFDALRAPFRRR